MSGFLRVKKDSRLTLAIQNSFGFCFIKLTDKGRSKKLIRASIGDHRAFFQGEDMIAELRYNIQIMYG